MTYTTHTIILYINFHVYKREKTTFTKWEYVHWLHVISDKDSLLYKIYYSERQYVVTRGYANCRSYKIKALLDNLGFSNIWLNKNFDSTSFIAIQQRLLDKYHQSSSSEISNTAKLELYCSFRE